MPRLSFPATLMVTFQLHIDRDKVQVPGGNLMRESVGVWMQAENCKQWTRLPREMINTTIKESTTSGQAWLAGL